MLLPNAFRDQDVPLQLGRKVEKPTPPAKPDPISAFEKGEHLVSGGVVPKRDLSDLHAKALEKMYQQLAELAAFPPAVVFGGITTPPVYETPPRFPDLSFVGWGTRSPEEVDAINARKPDFPSFDGTNAFQPREAAPLPQIEWPYGTHLDRACCLVAFDESGNTILRNPTTGECFRFDKSPGAYEPEFIHPTVL